MSRISHCGLRQAGSLRSSHSRGADGRQSPGSGACLGRPYPDSDKQFIILVNKGREGWNCRSLFDVALFRQPKSKIFVLQASMRCLRSIGDVQHAGHIYLSDANLKILDEELQQNFRMSADDLKSAAGDKETVEVRVNEPVVLKIKRVRRSFVMEEKVPVIGADLGFNLADKAAWAELTDKYRLAASIASGGRCQSNSERRRGWRATSLWAAVSLEQRPG